MSTDYTPIGPVPSGIANGTVDATSRQLARDMRGKAYGKDVRETIARMTEWHSIRTSASEVLAAQSAASAKASEVSAKQSAQNVTKNAQDSIKLFNDSIRQQTQKIDNMVVDLTDKDINSAPEIIAARRGKPSLGAKIDDVDRQLAQKAQQSEVNSISTKIDNIVVTPAEGITEQEIITSRVDGHGSEFHSLSSRLNALQKEATQGILEFTLNDWELGGIVASTGENNDSARRIRTSGYHSFKDEVRIVIDEGYQIIVYAYDHNEDTGDYTFNHNFGGYQTGEITLTNDYDAYRIMIDTLVDVTDTQLSSVITLERDLGIFETEQALAEEMEKARTDKHGNRFPSLERRLLALQREISEGVLEITLDDWEIGTISSADGASSENPRRIRSRNYHYLPFNFTIVIPEGYRIMVFRYTADTQEYIRLKTWATESYEYEGSTDEVYRFLISKVIEEPVSDIDLYADKFIFERYVKNKESLTLDYGFDMFCEDAEQQSNVVETDSYGRKIVSMSSENASFVFSRSFDVQQGQVVSVEAYAKVNKFDIDVGEYCRVVYRFSDESGESIYNNYYTYNRPIFVSVDRFAYHRFNTPIPRGAVKLDIRIYANNNSVSFTDFSIRSLSNVPKPARWKGLNYTAQGGLAYLAPNNTLDSVELVNQSGFNELVINTWATADGVLVSTHDRNVNKLFDGDANIDTLTYEQVQQLNSSYPLYYDTKLPKLEEMLKACARCGIHPTIRLGDLFSEVDDSDGIYAEIYRLILKYFGVGNATIKSFHYTKLDVAYSVMGKDVSYIYTHAHSAPSENLITELATKYGEGNFALDVDPNYMTEDIVTFAHSLGIPTSTYNVNTIQNAFKFAQMGVDNLCTTVLVNHIFPY